MYCPRRLKVFDDILLRGALDSGNKRLNSFGKAYFGSVRQML